MSANIQQEIGALMEGHAFQVGESTFVMRGGVARQIVTCYDGRTAEEQDTVELHDGRFAAADDSKVIELHDGRHALEDDAVELVSGGYALADEAIELGAGEHEGEYALPEEVIEDHNGYYILRDEACVVWCRGYAPSRYDVRAANSALSCGEDPGGHWMVMAESDRDNDDEIHYVERRDVYAHQGNLCFIEGADEWALEDDTVYIDGDHYYSDDDDVRTDYNGDYFLLSADTHRYCGDTNEYYPEDECHWCESEQGYCSGDEDSCSCCSAGAGRIGDYHDSCDRVQYYRGSSSWLVGFEVEKNNVEGASRQGEAVEENDLFAGWERDGSCGVEGVTHAFDPIDPVTVRQFRVGVDQARGQLNSDCSSDCGGHINLSREGWSTYTILDRFRSAVAPLFYAMWRYRLKNSHCAGNQRLDDAGADKYSVARGKSGGVLEIRLPNRVPNGDTLLRRFELMGLACKAMEAGHDNVRPLLKDARDLLLKSYGGDRAKVHQILMLTRDFQRWFKKGDTTSRIKRWVSPIHGRHEREHGAPEPQPAPEVGITAGTTFGGTPTTVTDARDTYTPPTGPSQHDGPGGRMGSVNPSPHGENWWLPMACPKFLSGGLISGAGQ